MKENKLKTKGPNTLAYPLLVSIVTPNYNGSKYIPMTIESVLRQDYQNVEFIVVDDGSTDDSLKIINSYFKKNPHKIKVISQPNRGQSSALNAGFKIAKGEIIGWINSDDTYCDDAISKIVDSFLCNMQAGIVFGNYTIIDKDSNLIRRVQQLPIDLNAGSLLGFGRLVASNSVFWRRDLFKKIGYLKEDFEYNMDGEFFSRLFFSSESVYINQNIANFRLHKNSKTLDQSKSKEDKLKDEFYQEVKKSYKKLSISRVVPFVFSPVLRFFYKCKRATLKFCLRLGLIHYS